ncbi:MAG: hypothetical protein JSR77_02700 [Planctomycetes bacterium]|nr:hypothetical protein [Planctomycetota bacterium]
MTRSLGGPGGGSGMVSKRAVEKYAEILGLSAEQKEAALTMQSGYAAAYAEKQKAMRDSMDEVRRAADDSGDQTVFMERMPKIEKDFREGVTKLEKDFFNDLKSLVSGAAQEEKWVKVERARRREVGLRQGTVSGESVDLISVVEGLKLSPEAAKNITPILDAYEAELDRQLQARDAGKADGPAWEPGKPIDIEQIQKQMKESREAGLKVREVNQNNAHKIEALLPEETRAAFNSAVRKASFPRVFREPRVLKELDAALKLSDLDAQQRESLNEIKASYQRDVEPVNNNWANAIEASDNRGDTGAIGGAGGGMVLSMNEESQDLKDARKARRELDEKASDKLRKVLRQDQKDKLPKQFEGDEEGGPGGRVMMIRRGE